MKNLLIFLFLIWSFNISAQQVQLPEGSVLEADFTQFRHLRSIPKPIKSQGHVILWNGKGLIWKTTIPFPSTILISKKGIYQFQNQKRTPILKAGGDNAMFDVMAGIFNLKYAGQINGFAIERLPAVDPQWIIRLLPQYNQVQNFIQSITVEGADQIIHISIYRPNGDHDEIELKNHTITNVASADIQDLFNE